jgi:hypothetical protein
MTAPVMMGITSPTGSHLPILEVEIAKLPPDALVIEHGAGLYSTVLLARAGVRVACAEEHEGWREWARFVYEGRAEMVEMTKRLVPKLPDAALVFIDGETRGRSFLLSECIKARAPVIIMHDTEQEHWGIYGHHAHNFETTAYHITHDNEPHRTTLWKLRQ